MYATIDQETAVTDTDPRATDAKLIHDAIQRIAAFSDGDQGGNPAGMWIGAELPAPSEMQRPAHEVGFSETAFAAPLPGGSIRVSGTARRM